ncbi:hypothetical protein ATE84_4141 [Aquimarina sp. MAR_2010_214]|nr:hypothetical protein ATE84_4141 [Aquimarina sp. MAR_2010_214]
MTIDLLMGQKDIPLDTSVSNLGIGVSKLGIECLILEDRGSNLDIGHLTLNLENLNFHQKAPTEG